MKSRSWSVKHRGNEYVVGVPTVPAQHRLPSKIAERILDAWVRSGVGTPAKASGIIRDLSRILFGPQRVHFSQSAEAKKEIHHRLRTALRTGKWAIGRFSQTSGASPSPLSNEAENKAKNEAEEEREEVAKSTPEAATEPNWIELQYCYADGEGVANASYEVWEVNGSSLATGSLDAKGFARVTLPEGVSSVEYRFQDDPEWVQLIRQPQPNSEQPKVQSGWLDRMGEAIGETYKKVDEGMSEARSWLWGTIQGDFNENPTVSQIITNMVITMIPVVDQIGDIRDIVANLKLLIFDKKYNDKWVWLALILTLLGCIPELGSLIKGVGKLVFKSIREGSKLPLRKLIEIVNWATKSHALRWLKKFRSELPQHGKWVKDKLHEILAGIRRALAELRERVWGSWRKQLDEWLQSTKQVDDMVDQQVDEVMDEFGKKLDEALEEVPGKQSGGAKSTQTTKQEASPPPEGGGAEGSSGEKLGSGLTSQSRKELLDSKESFEKLIAEHEQKLAEYKKNPFAHDNKGLLKNAPSEEIRQKIINGRVKVLESQIKKQRGELAKVVKLLGE